MKYLHWNQKTVTDFSDNALTDMYGNGYVFTRLGKGVMQQTRSVRIDLVKFELSSENRRMLKKVADLELALISLPTNEYDFQLGKLAKDFYDAKFGPGIMSAQKVKEMLTDPSRTNFNRLLAYSRAGKTEGYAIGYANRFMLHYSYPFYDLNTAPKDMGLGMMTLAIEHAKKSGLKYAYLGSLQRPSDTYKLQFAGLEWFDGAKWQNDLVEVKKILASGKMAE